MLKWKPGRYRPGSKSTRDSSESGQLLVETTIAIAVLVILTAGIAVLASGILSQSTARQRTIAEQLALQDMESIRQMAYGNVGLTTGNPHGNAATASSGHLVHGRSERDADASDHMGRRRGTRHSVHDSCRLQSRVTIKVVRRDGKVLTTQTSFVSPFDASDYGGPNVGSLQVTIQDMASTTVVTGVTVSIAGGPSGTASDVTDATGVASFPALQPNPASGPTKCYEITVTPPAGYVVYSSHMPASCGARPGRRGGSPPLRPPRRRSGSTSRPPSRSTSRAGRRSTPAATTTVNLSASIGGSPATAGPYTVPTTGTLTTAATFLPSSAWTVTATSGALTAPAQTIPIPTLAGYPTTSAATVAIAFPDTTITVKKRTTGRLRCGARQQSG